MSKSGKPDDELRPEYDINELLEDGVRGKYAERYAQGTNMVLLASDVAEAFPTSESVNEALRLVLRLSQIPSVTDKQPVAV
jgi:hypothetical protein